MEFIDKCSKNDLVIIKHNDMKIYVEENEEVVRKKHTTTWYVADDGKKFSSKSDCLIYEAETQWNKYKDFFDIRTIDDESNEYIDSILLKYDKNHDGEFRTVLNIFLRYCILKGGNLWHRAIENVDSSSMEIAESKINEKEFMDKEFYKVSLFFRDADPDYHYADYEIEISDFDDEADKIRKRIVEYETMFNKKFVL